MMTLTITARDLRECWKDGGMIVLTGTTAQGHKVTFGADFRACQPLLDAITESGVAAAQVDRWQVIDACELGMKGEDHVPRT